MKLNSADFVMLAALAWFGVKYKDNIPTEFSWGKPAVVETVNTKSRVVVAPSAELQAIVAPITKAFTAVPGRDKAADAYLFGDFFGDFADIVIKTDLVKNSKTFKDVMGQSGKLAFKQDELQTAYPQLVPALDKAILDAFGEQANPARQAEVCKAIQWAAYQAVNNGI